MNHIKIIWNHIKFHVHELCTQLIINRLTLCAEILNPFEEVDRYIWAIFFERNTIHLKCRYKTYAIWYNEGVLPARKDIT